MKEWLRNKSDIDVDIIDFFQKVTSLITTNFCLQKNNDRLFID